MRSFCFPTEGVSGGSMGYGPADRRYILDILPVNRRVTYSGHSKGTLPRYTTSITVPNLSCDNYSCEASKASPHSDSKLATNGLGEELARGPHRGLVLRNLILPLRRGQVKSGQKLISTLRVMSHKSQLTYQKGFSVLLLTT